MTIQALSTAPISNDLPPFWSLLIWLEIGVMVVWLLALASIVVRDRQSREAARCRQCGYDMRVTTSDNCPECGAKLTETGVWSPGKPRPAEHITWICLWLALCVAMGMGLTYGFDRNHRHVSDFRSIHLVTYPPNNTNVTITSSSSATKWPLLRLDNAQVESLSLKVTRYDLPSPKSLDLEIDTDDFSSNKWSSSWDISWIDGEQLTATAIADALRGPTSEDKGFETVTRDAILAMHVQIADQTPYWADQIEKKIGETFYIGSVDSRTQYSRPHLRRILTIPIGLVVLIWLLGLWPITVLWRRKNTATWPLRV